MTGPYTGKDIPFREISVDVLMARIDRQMDGCWEWRGYTSHGRPQLFHDGSRWNAKRVMWSVTHQQQVPDAMVIVQECGNPLCMSPLHMSAVTHGHALSLSKARKQKERAHAS